MIIKELTCIDIIILRMFIKRESLLFNEIAMEIHKLQKTNCIKEEINRKKLYRILDNLIEYGILTKKGSPMTLFRSVNRDTLYYLCIHWKKLEDECLKNFKGELGVK